MTRGGCTDVALFVFEWSRTSVRDRWLGTATTGVMAGRRRTHPPRPEAFMLHNEDIEFVTA